jgi:hypothetical protein
VTQILEPSNAHQVNYTPKNLIKMKVTHILTTCFFAAATAFSAQGQTVEEVIALHIAAKGGAALDSACTVKITCQQKGYTVSLLNADTLEKGRYYKVQSVKDTLLPSFKCSGVSVVGNLAVRPLKKRPRFEGVSTESGTIRVAVCVDWEGNVVKAACEKAGTTIDDAELLSLVEKNALQWKFAAAPDAQTQQCGHLVFRFKG